MGEKGQTTGDEEGERAERLREIRGECARRDGGYNSDQQAACFLLTELDRVTADRDEWKGSGLAWRDARDERTEERDAAIASRNAWAEKCERLMDLADTAWGVIANAGWRDESKSPGWDEAAARWRDRWHTELGVKSDPQPIRPALAATEEKP